MTKGATLPGLVDMTPVCEACGAEDSTLEVNLELSTQWVSFYTRSATPDPTWPASIDMEWGGRTGHSEMTSAQGMEREILAQFGVEITPEIEAKMTPQFECRQCSAAFNVPKFKENE